MAGVLARRAESLIDSLTTMPYLQALVLMDLGRVATACGKDDKAKALSDEAESLAGSTINEPSWDGWVMEVLPVMATGAGDLDRAENLVRSIRAPYHQARAMAALAVIVAAQGDHDRAEEVARSITDNHRRERTAMASIERYLRAFEAKTLPEDTCGHRIRELADKVAQLRERKIELLDALADVPPAPTENDLSQVRERVQEAVQHGAPAARKALIQSLVHEVRVTGRHHVQPVFRLPSAYLDVDAEKVRELSGSVPPAGFEPAAHGLGNRCSIP